jgi:hypothetical protein
MSASPHASVTNDLLQIAFCDGPSTNTRLTTQQLDFAELAQLLLTPLPGPKDGSYYVRGGELEFPRRSDSNLRSAELLILDGDKRFDPKTGEILEGAPPMEHAVTALERMGLNFFAHTSHSHVPGIREKWRIVIPCRMTNEGQLKKAYDYMLAHLHADEVFLQENSESRTWSQPWYMPRVRDQAALESFKYVAKLDGSSLQMKDVTFWCETYDNLDKIVESVTAKGAKRLHPDLKPFTQEDSPIRKFNSEHGLPWVMSELERHGYKFSHFANDKYRYIAPGSTTGMSGVVVFRGAHGDWCVYSHHGSHDPLSGKLSDPFDLYAIFSFSGDRSQAARKIWEDQIYGSANEHNRREEQAEPKPSELGAVWDPWAEPWTPPFPVDTLPSAVQRYVEARGIETGACRSAIAMSCLATASGALTHEAKLYLKPGKSFPVSPRLWVVLVGNPSAKKSPAMDGAIRPLLKFQKILNARQTEEWELEQAAEDKKRDRPDLTYYVLNDQTPEVLVDILSRQPRGVLVSADELAGWLGAHDRYGGSRAAASGRALWLTAYNGGYYNLQRLGRRTIPVENFSVSIIGGIQPERLRELGNLTADGLLQRFLPVWMAKPVLDSNMFNSGAWRSWEEAVQSLLEYGAFSTHLTAEAQNERERISQSLFTLGQIESEGTGWQGFVGKLYGVWGSLALLLHALWGYRAADMVDLATAKRASLILEEFVLPHGLAFYRNLTGSAQADNRSIAAFIAGWEGPIITVRDFSRNPRCCRGLGPDEINKRLQPFEAGGWLEPEKPGPWNRRWRVTAGLAERFRAQLERHRAAIAEIQEKIRGGHDDD